MDPSPLPAAIDALVASITSTSLTITNFIRAVRSARADLAAVTRELADLCLVLELLRDDHVVPTRMQPRVRAVLRCCGVILARVSALAAAASPNNGPGDATRARWSVKEKSEMVQLWIALQTYREALGLIDEVAHLSISNDDGSVIGVSSHAQGLKHASRRILGEISHLRDMVPQAETVTGDSRMALDLYLNDLVTYTAVVCREMRRRQKSMSEQHTSQTAPEKSKVGTQRHLAQGHSDKSPNPVESEGLAPVTTSKEPRRQAQQTSPDPRTVAVARQDSQMAELDSQPSLETCGPWFPTQQLVVPYYNNQEKLLKPGAYSYHVPRQLPPSPSRAHEQQQVSELSSQTADAREVARPAEIQRLSEQHQAAKETDQPSAETEHSPLTQHQDTSPPLPPLPPLPSSPPPPLPPYRIGSPESMVSAGQRGLSPPDQFSPSPLLAPPEGRGTSMYVPDSPTSDRFSQRTSDLSSDQTSFQTSDSTLNPSTYRSSISTAGTRSGMDSSSFTSSPRLPYRPLLKPNPSSRTESSYSTVSSITSSIMGRIPGFRARRRSVYPSPVAPTDSVCSTSPSSTTTSSLTVDRAPLVRVRSVQQTPTNLSLSHTPQTSPGEAPEKEAEGHNQHSEHQIELVQSEGLSDGKTAEILHLDISPSGCTLASQHAGHTIKIWSVTTGAVECTINPRVKFQASMRSRMYFIHSHAIISETSTLIAVSASFGNTIEVWNWARRKRIQSIDHAARWACVRAEVNQRPLAVYRSEANRIDLFANAARDDAASILSSSTVAGGSKKAFILSRHIEVNLAGLPFVPHFPDLAYSATAPLLVGAAGPRPRAAPDQQQCMLMAWQTDDPQDSGDDDFNPHRPYKWVVPPHPELLGALPASLACYGSSAVSVWFPANYRHILTAKGEWKRVPVAVTKRHVVVWDFSANTTRLISVPSGACCVSPDCRFVAYCDAAAGAIVVLDVASGEVAWDGAACVPSPSSGKPVDLKKVNVLQFTDDAGMLFVGDKEGGVGIYEIKMRPAGGMGRFGIPDINEVAETGESMVSRP